MNDRLTDDDPSTSSPQFDVHSEKCPVCNGFGTLSFGRKVCHGCGGKGYILVPNTLKDRNNEDPNS